LPRYDDFSIFQNGDCASSWICYACVCIIREEHLVVLIVMQNLVGIVCVVLKVCELQYYAPLA